MGTGDFKPLVVGAPRTGFSLLINVLSELYPLTPGKADGKRRLLRAFVDKAGGVISATVEETLAGHGIREDLIYNDNFRQLLGGPKWLCEHDRSRACFRKYIGVRGKGDFTLITSHPREILDCDAIVHSHSHPSVWAAESAYEDYLKFASIRDPVDTVNSACFSINALTSEYIQRFLRPKDDNDGLRQHLALYKLTDLDFFEGLVRPLTAYLEEFLACREAYHEMQWEDLIARPVETIGGVAVVAGVPIDEAYAREIWSSIGHRNLTGAHKHNYRRGHGRIGGWKSTLTNEHLAVFRECGMEPLSGALGYGKICDLDPGEYTPFQRKVSGYIRRGESFQSYDDPDLFEFAFNKSNLDASKFPRFKSYDWREHTRVERSSFEDEVILEDAWAAAEAAAGVINQALEALIALEPESRTGSDEDLRRFASAYTEELAGTEGADQLGQALVEAWSQPASDPPRLVRSVGRTNVVSYAGRLYGVPKSLGPVDLGQEDVDGRPGVVVAPDLASLMNRLEADQKRRTWSPMGIFRRGHGK